MNTFCEFLDENSEFESCFAGFFFLKMSLEIICFESVKLFSALGFKVLLHRNRTCQKHLNAIKNEITGSYELFFDTGCVSR